MNYLLMMKMHVKKKFYSISKKVMFKMKKYIEILVKISAIFLLVVGLLILYHNYGYVLYNKPSKLICVGMLQNSDGHNPSRQEIDTNDSTYLRAFWGSKGYAVIDSADIENELLALRLDDQIVATDDEINQIISVVGSYTDYSKVVLSWVKSDALWTRRHEPHVTFINAESAWMSNSGSKTNVSDRSMIYVYVTKCTEFDMPPVEWGVDW